VDSHARIKARDAHLHAQDARILDEDSYALPTQRCSLVVAIVVGATMRSRKLKRADTRRDPIRSARRLLRRCA